MLFPHPYIHSAAPAVTILTTKVDPVSTELRNHSFSIMLQTYLMISDSHTHTHIAPIDDNRAIDLLRIAVILIILIIIMIIIMAIVIRMVEVEAGPDSSFWAFVDAPGERVPSQRRSLTCFPEINNR